MCNYDAPLVRIAARAPHPLPFAPTVDKVPTAYHRGAPTARISSSLVATKSMDSCWIYADFTCDASGNEHSDLGWIRYGCLPFSPTLMCAPKGGIGNVAWCYPHNQFTVTAATTHTTWDGRPMPVHTYPAVTFVRYRMMNT